LSDKIDISKLPIEFVAAPPSARNYIKSTWLMSNRKSRWYEGVESSLYYKKHGELVEHLIDTRAVRVARWTEHPEQLYGWICYDDMTSSCVVHYCYVGAKYRGIGLARALLQEVPSYLQGERIVATHYSQVVSPHIERKFHLEHNPYYLHEV